MDMICFFTCGKGQASTDHFYVNQLYRGGALHQDSRITYILHICPNNTCAFWIRSEWGRARVRMHVSSWITACMIPYITHIPSEPKLDVKDTSNITLFIYLWSFITYSLTKKCRKKSNHKPEKWNRSERASCRERVCQYV